MAVKEHRARTKLLLTSEDGGCDDDRLLHKCDDRSVMSSNVDEKNHDGVSSAAGCKSEAIHRDYDVNSTSLDRLQSSVFQLGHLKGRGASIELLHGMGQLGDGSVRCIRATSSLGVLRR